MSLMPLARDERAEFADLLATLTPQQWATPSLCTGWTVHDVVAHVLSYDELSLGTLVGTFARGRFMTDRVNAVALADCRRRGSDELVDLMREHVRPSGLPAAFGGMIALTDGMIHQQDIRRPLGLPRKIPAERIVPALRTALYAPVIRGFWRVRGVRLVATDLEWTSGRGPEVRGAAEALLMVIGGRKGIVAELSGPGCAVLARRIDG
jgi:uncharacterized protein (TIGR03083 family)